MADIQAFRGLRYDLGKVGALSEVVAPPYDVIDAELQNALYQINDFNVIRLILNRGDDLMDDQSIYDRAAEHLKDWRRTGVLREENEGTIYVYHQTFSFEGQEYTRRGFMARVLIEPFGEGMIYPHEETHSKAKEDRFKLMSACRCNLSQIFGIYPDQENRAQEILEAAIDDKTPLTVEGTDGVRHEMWMVKDPDAVAAAAKILGPKPVYIADGHHRYETACNIRQSHELANQQDDHPVNYVLMMCVSMFDPGMAVLPTHRLFRGLEPMASTELIEKLGDHFECEPQSGDLGIAQDVWDAIQVEGQQECLGFYCRKDDRWVLAKMTEVGREWLKSLEPERSEYWRSLGVAILHSLVIGNLLGVPDPESLPSPMYVHSIDEVVTGLKAGDSAGRDSTGQAGTGDPFELGCLVMPASVEHVRAISEEGERMPAKSTYFYPKLLSGLVINPID